MTERDAEKTCVFCRILRGELTPGGTSYDPLQLWLEVASDVRGHALPGGHNLPEELPERIISEVLAFVPAGS